MVRTIGRCEPRQHLFCSCAHRRPHRRALHGRRPERRLARPMGQWLSERLSQQFIAKAMRASLSASAIAIRFHPTLSEFAGHCRYDPRPVAIGRGNEKGRVERARRRRWSWWRRSRRWGIWRRHWRLRRRSHRRLPRGRYGRHRTRNPWQSSSLWCPFAWLRKWVCVWRLGLLPLRLAVWSTAAERVLLTTAVPELERKPHRDKFDGRSPGCHSRGRVVRDLQTVHRSPPISKGRDLHDRAQ
jgi:hypothetical protein